MADNNDKEPYIVAIVFLAIALIALIIFCAPYLEYRYSLARYGFSFEDFLQYLAVQ